MKEDVMRRLVLVVLLCIATNAFAGGERAAFDRLKRLAGEWDGRSTKGWTDRNRVEVIAGGSVVMMQEMDAHPGERMATMFHMDGDRLLLTHYCVAGNQPRMVATEISEDGRRIVFTFLDGTGMASRDVGHMDQAVYELIDDDHYATQWTWYANGKERWMERVERQRVKR
jgi:hypothetical protein